MQLRHYQAEAATAALAALRRGAAPALQLATGTGKSLIIAEVAQRLRERGGRTWVLSHAQQLIGQNASTYERHTGDAPGVVCAGLQRADYDREVTFATIQSMAGPAERGELPEPHLIIIDEAHRVPHRSGDQGQYERLLQRYPAARRLAMTATPWRTDGGLIYGAAECWFTELAYRYTVPQAVRDGYLCPIVGVETEQQLDLTDLPLNGDYVQREAGERQAGEWLRGAVASIQELSARRRHVAVYCSTVAAATRTQQALGSGARLLIGETRAAERDDLFSQWVRGEFKYLVSVDALTTGFDFPALDCVACLRPTAASNLWVQIMGRGTRLHPGKRDCLLLDYAGNLQRLGGVDTLETYVRQRAPQEPLPAEPAADLRAPRTTYPGVRSLAAIDPLTGEQARDGAELELEVHGVNAVAITTRRDPGRRVLLVQYACTTAEGARIDASAFHDTERPSPETREFCAVRRLPVALPAPAQHVAWALKKAARPARLTARKAGKYWNTVQEHFAHG